MSSPGAETFLTTSVVVKDEILEPASSGQAAG